MWRVNCLEILATTNETAQLKYCGMKLDNILGFKHVIRYLCSNELRQNNNDDCGIIIDKKQC